MVTVKLEDAEQNETPLNKDFVRLLYKSRLGELIKLYLTNDSGIFRKNYALCIGYVAYSVVTLAIIIAWLNSINSIPGLSAGLSKCAHISFQWK